MTALANQHLLAWQGWSLMLPNRWNPVKIEGDYEAGSVMIADLHRPRLGIRWKRAGVRLDPAQWATKALREEVGELAAAEARGIGLKGWDASLLYTDPEPPGRDVWVAHSSKSRRCIEIVHHAHRRENILEGTILPELRDLPGDVATPWSIFDLACTAPAGFTLATHRLNAGDLSLTFEKGRQTVMIRQIALASMALKRMGFDGWLADEESRCSKHYRPAGDSEQIELNGLPGVTRTMRRRRRFVMMRSLPPQLITAALHDQPRDRLVIVQASDDTLLRESSAHVGEPIA
jgi:hypothetical protein